MGRDEPIPLFKQGERVIHDRIESMILTVSTYCVCCDRFLDNAEYSVVDINTRKVSHKVKEDLIDYSGFGED